MNQWQRLKQGVEPLVRRHPGLYLGVALFVLSMAQYAYTLGNPLIWDSRTILLTDPSIRSLANIPAFFLQSSLPPTELASDMVPQLDYYRPLLKIVYALEYAWFGTEPLPYHLMNVVLNAGVVLMLFALVRALTGNLALAFAASAIYAVNPSRGEAVSWVYGFSELAMALCMLAALYFYHARRHAWAAAVFALGLLSRESAVLFPAILLCYEFLLRPGEPARRFLNILPYAVLAAAYLVLRTAVIGGLPPITAASPAALVSTAAVVLQRYLKIFVLPDAPVAFYRLELFEPADAEALVSFGVAALAIAGLVWLWRNDRPTAFWYLWFFVWISIYFNLGRFADFLMAEKFMYLASAGLSVVVAALFLRLRFAPVLLSLVVAAHFGITFARTTYWRDPVTFFTAAAEFSPEFVRLRYELGVAYVDKRDCAAASLSFERVIARVPNHSLALNNLGNCYYVLGDRSRAVTMWSRALAADRRNAMAAFNLGFQAEQAGRPVEALGFYRTYLEVARDVPPQIMRRIRNLERALGSPGKAE